MENTPEAAPRIVLHPFRALRLAESLVGAPFANRVFARPYRAVPGRLLDWRRKRQLCDDPEPGFYLHEYTSAGVSVRGIVANLELEPADGLVLPHEGVSPDQVAQLAHRMRVMRLNPAPILLVHRGHPGVRTVVEEVAARPPDRSYTDRDEQVHRVWRIGDATEQRRVTAALEHSSLVIADGHHRYAAAWQLLREEADDGWDRTLVMLVDAGDSPLQLGAIHRSLSGVDLRRVEEVARERGDELVRHSGRAEALSRLQDSLVLHTGDEWATLRPVGEDDLLVRVLHEELLPAWRVRDRAVRYHHTAGEAIEAASRGLAVLLPAPTFDQVADAAARGELLPHKATSFQPKPHLGAIMRDLRDG